MMTFLANETPVRVTAGECRLLTFLQNAAPAGWWVRVGLGTLHRATGLTSCDVGLARDLLTNKGLVEYSPGNATRATAYRVVAALKDGPDDGFEPAGC